MKISPFRVFWVISMISLLMCACKKDVPDDLMDSEMLTEIMGDRYLFVEGDLANDLSQRDEDDEKMILGQQRNNPYTVAKMTEAWNNLYEPNLTSLPVSDLYVRFLPANGQEFKILTDLDILLFDFPLDYEIIKDGEFYHDPLVPENQITWQYAVVKPDFVFPNIQYEILASLVLPPYEALLTREAFRLTGTAWGDVVEGGGVGGNNFSTCTTACPNFPCCLEEGIECDDVPCVTGGAPCNPSSPNWPDCLNTSGSGSTDFVNNDCGCRVYADHRKPGGCIDVVDTQLPDNATLNGSSVHLEGVRQVEVIFKDDWFIANRAMTDYNGCWKINRRHSGRTWMWVRFKNDRAVIRGIRGARLWEYAQAVKDYVGVIAGPIFNNIQVAYTPTNTDDATSRLFWYSATCNNALYEFYEFADQDNIGTPPTDLDILLANYTGSASAPMFDDLTGNPIIALSAAGVAGILFGIPVPVLGELLSGFFLYLTIYAPDVAYFYGNEPNRPSDVVKETFYHEFAHAAHYKALDDDEYWLNNIIYIIQNGSLDNPYGDGTAPGADRCAVIEMWGNHIGPIYADRRYGLNHSNTSSVLISDREETRHIYQLEGFIPNEPGEEAAWIPEGFFYDCIDDNVSNPGNVADGVLLDDVKNFSHHRCFQALIQSSASSPQLVRHNLVTPPLPSGQNAQSVKDLMTSYGWD